MSGEVVNAEDPNIEDMGSVEDQFLAAVEDEESGEPQEETPEEPEDESEAEEDAEEAAEPESEDEPEEPGEEEDSPELPPGVRSQKAQQRFQQLANERRELKEQNKQLQELIRQFQERQPPNEYYDLQMQQLRAQQEQSQALAQRRELEQRAYEMQSLGLDPNDAAHVQTYMQQFEAQKRYQQLEEKLQKIEEERQQEQERQRVEAYRQQWSQALYGSLADQLKGYNIQQNQLGELTELAWSQAIAMNIADPQEAAQRFVQRMGPYLQAAKKQTAPKADPRVMRGVSTRGMTGNSKPSRPKRPGATIEDDAFAAIQQAVGE